MDRRIPIITVEIANEGDVVKARQRVRQVAEHLGFGGQDQTRIATAVSEMARNAQRYAGGGRCEVFLEGRALGVRIADDGPGIRHLDEVLAGRYRSDTGMGLGILGAQRLSDRFRIQSAPGKGTEVELFKELPATEAKAPAPAMLARELSRPQPPLDTELQASDRELLRAIAELRARSEELDQLRTELEETNRGVVALYAELDEKAESLRKATELKSRFLANMSHEFRTPLNSVQSLTRILLDGSEGALTEGQAKAVSLIRKSAEGLAEMVNDLLDLAKIEAGKVTVRATAFEAAHLFGSLRALLRPLLGGADGPSGVELVFEDVSDLPQLDTDEGKVAQVLRNFVSNALKFTAAGEVRVAARAENGAAIFTVRDTGIGIAPEDQERIFEEFAQVEGTHQRKVKGTGLGLPLSRKLAQMLGGEIGVESEPGRGSTFWLRVPLRYTATRPDGSLVVALVDNAQLVARWEQACAGTRYHLAAPRSLEEARALLQQQVPAAVLAGLFLGGQPTRTLLAELKKDERTRHVPVLGIANAEHEARSLALGTDVIAGPLQERHQLLEALSRALSPARRVLIVAPASSSPELRTMLSEPGLELLDARDAADAVRRAREVRLSAAVVDLAPGGFAPEVMRHLHADAATAELPVVVLNRTQAVLTEQDARELAGAQVVEAAAFTREEAGRRLRAAVWNAGGAHA